MTKTHWLNIILFLAAIATASLWWYRAHPSFSDYFNFKQPTIVMRNVTAVRFTAQGTLRYRLLTPLITYHQAKKVSDFSHPHLSLYQPNTPAWTVTANRGNSDGDFAKVQLNGDVNITQAASATRAATVITTQAMTIYPRKKQATSKKLVKMRQDNNTIEGVGMVANFKTGTVKLLSKVTANYENQIKSPLH